MIPGKKLKLRCDYAFYEKLMRKAAQKGWSAVDVAFDSDVSLTLQIPESETGEAETFLADESCGKVIPVFDGEIMIPGEEVSLI